MPGIRNLINLPACPANAENLAALVVYYITFDRLPPTDSYRRPLTLNALRASEQRSYAFLSGLGAQCRDDAGVGFADIGAAVRE